jgi:hypothetical protein
MGTAPQGVTSEARVATDLSPRRYLGQLCKHFQHKLPVTFDEDFTHGRIEFSVGVCELEADEGQNLLIMQAKAGSDADLARLEDVVARHLVRFAFRQELTVAWQQPSHQAG